MLEVVKGVGGHWRNMASTSASRCPLPQATIHPRARV
jgi:hypothetical protein